MDTPASRSGIDIGQLEPLCNLDDPTRRTLYDYVVAHRQPVTRDQASGALGIERSTAAYHLDRLVAEGLLLASFARPAGRGGPGAGRPAKRYQRSDREFAVSVPPRNYRLAAEVLARAAEADPTGAVGRTLEQAASQLGQELVTNGNDPSDGLLGCLAQHGFEPYQDEGVVRLRNCPFGQLAREHTDLICGMNLAMLTAAVEAARVELDAQLDPSQGDCCVVFVPKSQGDDLDPDR